MPTHNTILYIVRHRTDIPCSMYAVQVLEICRMQGRWLGNTQKHFSNKLLLLHIYKYSTGMCKGTCTLCTLTSTLNVHYENLQFDRVKGHVRDPFSNSILLLTSSKIVPSFIILRLIVLELSWKRTDGRTDRQTDGHTRRSHKAFLWSTY